MGLSDIIDMGRYTGYVWSSVVLTAAILIGNAWFARRALKAEIARARRRVAAAREAS